MKQKTIISFILLAVVFSLTIGPATPSVGTSGQPLVYSVSVSETVTSGTARHIERGLRLAEQNQASAVVILLNTPGGLVSATLEIIQDMSASRVPVITYVTPQGAISASAGTFILLNGHLAAMSPGTTCGAAMPVTMSSPGEAPRAADQKTINFLAGHMRSIAVERGRPADLAEKFVTENLVLDNREALEKGVVDLNAADTAELLEKIHGRTVRTQAGERQLATAGAQLTEVPLSVNEQFLHLISNPTFSMILLMLGIYGLIIGFYSPGFFLPEILGSICLLLGLAGTGMFQGNLAAGLLILLGIGLLVAEIYTPTYGILGVGGVISVVLGILFFPVEPLMPVGWFAAFKALSISVGIAGMLFLAIVVLGISRLRKIRPAHGESEFVGATALVVKELNPEGQVKMKAEIWQAITKEGHTINVGEKVQVLERQGMTLIVGPAANKEKI